MYLLYAGLEERHSLIVIHYAVYLVFFLIALLKKMQIKNIIKLLNLILISRQPAVRLE